MRKLALAPLLLLAAFPASARDDRLRVVPAVFDPGHTHGVISRWTALAGRDDAALVMAKILPTSADAAAVAAVEGVAGARLDELGFDVFGGGHCGAGAPRFDVTTRDGSVYFFGCSYGIHSPSPDHAPLFTRVRFSDADAVAQLASDPPWPGFGKARVASIELVFDEGTDAGSGFTALDDIDINGELVTGPHSIDESEAIETTVRPPRR
jgi:hypothetical protein